MALPKGRTKTRFEEADPECYRPHWRKKERPQRGGVRGFHDEAEIQPFNEPSSAWRPQRGRQP